jgi:feruloyl esterase
MYAGAYNPRTGARIYFGWPPGSEAGWRFYWADPSNPAAPARAAFWRHWVFGGRPWDWQRFDFDRDMARADTALARLINAMDANLEPFRRRGGKLIHYHGTADPVVPHADSISYHQRVVQEQKRGRRLASADEAAQATAEFYRFFLAPGFGHCQGGPGAAPVELQQALEDWVERGRAPDRLLATRNAGGVNDEAFSRPLCLFPQIARYHGSGPPNDAASFFCSAPEGAPIVLHPAPEYQR